MEHILPTTKYSPRPVAQVPRSLRDPRDAVGRIVRRTKHMHPVFHHARAFARVVGGVAFILGFSYIVAYPHNAEHTLHTVALYLSTLIRTDSMATVLNAFK